VKPYFLRHGPAVARNAWEAEDRERPLTAPGAQIVEREAGFDVDGLESILAERASLESILFVGHEPSMSSIIKALIGGGQISMKKGSLACVKGVTATDLHGRLAWLLSPSVMSVD